MISLVKPPDDNRETVPCPVSKGESSAFLPGVVWSDSRLKIISTTPNPAVLSG